MTTTTTETVRSSVIDGLTVREHDGEPMVLDLELAERLGYARPRVVRDLINRLLKEGKLNDSDLRRTVRRTEAP